MCVLLKTDEETLAAICWRCILFQSWSQASFCYFYSNFLLFWWHRYVHTQETSQNLATSCSLRSSICLSVSRILPVLPKTQEIHLHSTVGARSFFLVSVLKFVCASQNFSFKSKVLSTGRTFCRQMDWPEWRVFLQSFCLQFEASSQLAESIDLLRLSSV